MFTSQDRSVLVSYILLFIYLSAVNRQLVILAVLAFMVYEGISLINCIICQDTQQNFISINKLFPIAFHLLKQ